MALVVDRESKTAANKWFAITGAPYFADTFVQGGSSILRINFGAKTPRHRNPQTVMGNIKQTRQLKNK